MKKILLSLLIVFSVAMAHAQWVQQTSGVTFALSDVYFINQDTGFVIGGDNILRTVNSGQTWESYASPYFLSLMRMSFPTPETGYAVGLDLTTNKSTVVKTTNGGNSWANTNMNYNKWLMGTCFLSANYGFAVGEYGKAYRTTDGGLSWDSLVTGTNLNLESVFFTDSLNGIAVGGGLPFPALILKTNDGGNSWSEVSSGATNYLLSVYFPSPQIGYIAGWNGNILKTTDGGSSWTTQTPVDIYGNLDVFFIDDNTGYVVGGDEFFAGIMKTTDGGQTWVAQSAPVSAGMEAIYFINPDLGFCVGNLGTILKTTNGGMGFGDEDPAINVQIFPNPTADYLTISFDNVNADLAANISLCDAAGKIVYTTGVSENNQVLDLRTLKSGMYFMTVTSENHEYITKLIRE
ncbi:MAG: hypothetical protein CVU11_14950 [Bacteroidetes bacterium HGW-Bacteroidetes-6]|jgi:photosystem II stability/assembly factor-like uncharacterized protein|nr:MAG: hypothetical protein CVU11_14950 [Bacteroidetes bacterium HGW-Bacteroidetes-6]